MEKEIITGSLDPIKVTYLKATGELTTRDVNGSDWLCYTPSEIIELRNFLNQLELGD